MSTLADELLNDFEDSGDENEDQTLQDHEPTDTLNGNHHDDNEGDVPENAANDEIMEEDEEEKEFVQADVLEDEDETKAKVEKMHLGLVRDVRSVAGLMKTLQPVLDVSSYHACVPCLCGLHLCVLALTVCPS